MKCPACDNKLTETTAGGVHVDVCKGGCGGLWFDNLELKRFDEPCEAAGEQLLDVERNKDLIIDRSKKLKCPKCDNTVMMRHFFSVKREVEIDECPGCGSIWLDSGELGRIRQLFDSGADRDQAFEAYFQELFGEKLKQMSAESKVKAQNAQRFANMFRFVCPSKYIPGKQSGGVF